MAHEKHIAAHAAALLTVKEAQEALNFLYGDSAEPLAVDGISGPKTRAALVKYQHEHGLKATGQLDAQTQQHLIGDRDTLAQLQDGPHEPHMTVGLSDAPVAAVEKTGLPPVSPPEKVAQVAPRPLAAIWHDTKQADPYPIPLHAELPPIYPQAAKPLQYDVAPGKPSLPLQWSEAKAADPFPLPLGFPIAAAPVEPVTQEALYSAPKPTPAPAAIAKASPTVKYDVLSSAYLAPQATPAVKANAHGPEVDRTANVLMRRLAGNMNEANAVQFATAKDWGNHIGISGFDDGKPPFVAPAAAALPAGKPNEVQLAQKPEEPSRWQRIRHWALAYSVWGEGYKEQRQPDCVPAKTAEALRLKEGCLVCWA